MQRRQLKTITSPHNSSINVSPLQHELIGLSPQYWSFTPSQISDIHDLILVNGVDCIVMEETASDANTNDTASNERAHSPYSDRLRVLPISKCILCGIICYSHAKANGSTQYILDDGSGVIDCIAWENLQSSMPSLQDPAPHAPVLQCHYGYTGETYDNQLSRKRSRMERKATTNFDVGECVKVYGRIHCISVSSQSTAVIHSNDGIWEGRRCTREISIISMQSVSGDHNVSTRDSMSWTDQSIPSTNDIETVHWLKCLQFWKRCKSLPRHLASQSYVDEDQSHELHKVYEHEAEMNEMPILNGAEVLQVIPSNMQRHIMEAASLSSSQPVMSKQDKNEQINDDPFSTYFEKTCECTCGKDSYKHELLYCHCTASSEKLDPLYLFRDALLGFLCSREKAKCDDPNPGFLFPDVSDGLLDKGIDDCHNGLFFTYESIAREPYLLSVAQKVLSEKKAHEKATYVGKLYINTFHWLRKDGVVSLVDPMKDIYLLISKKYVLVPCVRELIHREKSWEIMKTDENSLMRNLPPCLPKFLANVPRSRITAIRKNLHRTSA